MNALAVMLLAATVGVDYGWTNRDDGGVEYIIQIEPQVAEALRSGDLPDGVTSVVMPEVQNVRAFRIVIGDDDLPREDVALTQAAEKPIDGGVPEPNMLAADTAPSLGSRYNNPRYADPVAGPSATIRRATESTSNAVRDTTGRLIENANTQLNNEASRLGQNVESAIQNGSQNVAETLRNGLQQARDQVGLNPASNTNATNGTTAHGNAAGGQSTPDPRVQSQFQVQPSQYNTTGNQYLTTQPNQYPQDGARWPQADPNNVPPTNPNPSGYNSNTQREWTNWQPNQQPTTTQPQPNRNPGYQNQNPGYQNPATPNPGFQTPWAGQQQPSAPANQPGYQNPGYQGPYQQQPGTTPTAPPLQPTIPYAGNQYLAANPGAGQPPAITPPTNQGPAVPVQTVGTHDHAQGSTPQTQQPAAGGTTNQGQGNTGQANANATASKDLPAGSESKANHQQPPVRSAPDPDSFQWLIMLLFLFSVSGNVVLWYLANNFKRQSQKIAMQLRRARAV